MEIGLKVTRNSDKFRKPAIHFQKHGMYTFAPPGTSEYLKFWTKEMEYCIDGYTAEDGDRIPGYFYFYLNYFPINLVKEVEVKNKNGTVSKRTVKERDFPRFYDYDRFFFESVEEAEKTGHHLIVLKARRKGYSYKVSSMLDRNFYFHRDSKGFALASEAEYLTKDGILTKAWDGMDFLDQHTAWYKKRQAKNQNMHRRASFVTKDRNGSLLELGYKSEIIGVTLKNDPQKARGKCFAKGTEILMADGSIKCIEDVSIGDKVMGPDSKPRKVLELHTGRDKMYKIIPKNGKIQIVNSNHEIYHKYYDWKFNSEKDKLITAPEYMKLSNSKKARSKLVKTEVEYQYKEVPLDPYYIGLWLGDGSHSSTEIISEDVEILQYVEDYVQSIGCIPYKYSKKDNDKVITIGASGGEKGVHKNKIINIFKSLNLYKNKHIPKEYLINDRDTRLKILAGIVDSDGYYDVVNGRFEIIQKRKELSENIVTLSRSLGFKTSINEKYIEGYGVYYRIRILSGIENIPTLLPRKQASFHSKKYVKNPLHSTFKIEEYKEDTYYGFTVDKDNLFLLSDFTISHNSGKLIIFEEAGKFPHLLQTWQIARPSVEQGSHVFGTMIAFGTGGSEGADFESLKELFERPMAYNCLTFENIWDPDAAGQSCGFFIPQYANLEGTYHNPGDPDHGKPFMDEDGNTNAQLAKRYILEERQKVIENASDKRAIDRHIAEAPVTPAEATLNISTNIFPKADLQRHLADIRNNEKIKNFKQVGELYFDTDGKVKWQQTPKAEQRDITKYKLDKNDDPTGQIVIWEHPSDNPPWGMYIGGTDPYDHDKSGTNSLGSTFIYKRFQTLEKYYDIPVAEYTGRPNTANEYYENVRKLLLYYNATLLYENEKKGLFFYFEKNHCTHLLADQPGDLLRDVVKDSSVDRKKGIHMNTAIKDWGEGAIRDWLVEEYEPGRKNLTKIYSEALLEELISYNDDGNFDRCLVPGTNIFTNAGYKDIKDVKPGDVVLSHTGNYRKVTAKTFNSKYNKILKLKTVGNYEDILVTDNHPILAAYISKKKHVYRKEALNNIGFVEAKNLKYKYQFALQPKRKNLKSSEFEEDFLYLLGWYIADGYVNKDSNNIKITFQIDQKHIAEKLAKIIDKYTENEYSVHNNRKYYSKNAYITKGKGNWYNLHKTSKFLSDLLLKHGGSSNNKNISEEIFNSSNTLPLIIGYLEGDGHQRKNHNYDSYKREYIECSTIYENLIKQIRQLLIDNSIWSSIRKIKSRNKGKCQYSISISRKYINKIASKSLKFKEVNNLNIREKEVQYETSEGFWTPIKIVEEVPYDGFVYNIEVEKDNSYIANNIATHNCMAYMMVMLYKQQLHHVHVKKKKKLAKKNMLFPEPVFAGEVKERRTFI